MPLSELQSAELRSAVRDFQVSPTPFAVLELLGTDLDARTRREVLAGLEPPFARRLPTSYLYDHAGSELFDAITRTPEYYLTRVEAALLDRIALDLADKVRVSQLVELGSGTATKTRLLLDALREGDRPLTYLPIDISKDMLTQTAEQLVDSYPGMRVLALSAEFDDALTVIPPQTGSLFIFLGATLGNFSLAEQEAFVSALHHAMRPGNHLLLGVDLQAHARKPPEVIQAAYDDAKGIVARFNLNALRRLNREFAADFDLARWAHEAIYNPDAHQIEMRAVSQVAQTVTVAGRPMAFAEGEGILTAISRRFDPDDLSTWLARRGFVRQALWTDEHAYYGLMLLRRDP